MYDTYMPNKTISVPDDVIPIIERLGVPFSTWVADQLRHHAAIRSEASLSQQLLADAELASAEPPTRADSLAALDRMERSAPWRSGNHGDQGTMVIREGATGGGVIRGGVYWIDLDRRRPCVVVSSDDVLSVNVWQSHVVPVTSNVARAGIAGNVLLASRASGLPRDSVAVPLGLELIDRSILGERAGTLPRILIDDIDEGLRAVLGL